MATRPRTSRAHHRAPDRLRPAQAQGGRALHPRPGHLPGRHQAARAWSTARSCAARTRTPGSSRSTPRAALAHPNVAAVVTAKDLETLGLAWMPTISYDTQAVLAGDKVRFQGQEVAFVIATDEYSAQRRAAADRRRVRAAAGGRQRPQGARPRRAADPRRQGRPARQPRQPDLGGRRRGRDRPAFAEADTVVRRDIIYPRCHPAPLETCGMIADFNPQTGQLDIYNGNQAPHAHRTVYAHVAGLAEHMIRIRCNDIGGGFGNKVPVYPGYVCAIAGSIVAGVPVKWVEDRSENLMSTGFARDYVMQQRDVRQGRQDHRPAGRRDRRPRRVRLAPRSRRSSRPGSSTSCCGSYDLQASHVKVKAVYTNKAPGGVAYRCSFRITEAVYLVERMVDALGAGDEGRPDRAADAQLHRARAVPLRDDHRLDVRLRQLRRDDAGGDGYRRLRGAPSRAGGEARARRADGHRRRRSSPRASAPARASTWTSSAWR